MESFESAIGYKNSQQNTDYHQTANFHPFFHYYSPLDKIHFLRFLQKYEQSLRQ